MSRVFFESYAFSSNEKMACCHRLGRRFSRVGSGPYGKHDYNWRLVPLGEHVNRHDSQLAMKPNTLKSELLSMTLLLMGSNNMTVSGCAVAEARRFSMTWK